MSQPRSGPPAGGSPRFGCHRHLRCGGDSRWTKRARPRALKSPTRRGETRLPRRYAKESALTSPNLAQLSAGAERLFWRSMVKADDYGRFDADPEIVRGGCLPKVPCSLEEVAGWLQEMAKARLI